VPLDPVKQGETAVYTVTLRDAAGVVLVDTFAGTETFDLDLWLGDDAEEVALTDSEATWDDYELATVTMSLGGSDTADLAPPGYWLRLWLVSGSTRVVCFQDWLPIEPTAGTGEALRTYGGFAAIVDEYPGVIHLIAAAPTMKADLSDLRHKAALWVDRQVMARLERDLRHQAQRHSPVAELDPIEPTTGLDYGPAWGSSTIPDTTLEDHLSLLQGYLDAGYVASDTTLEQIATTRTLAYLFAQQSGDKPDSPYLALAQRYGFRAARMLAGYTVRIDVPAPEDALGISPNIVAVP
jgi:hypothetical protein